MAGNKQDKSSLLSKLLAEEEDTNEKSDLDFITLMSKEPSNDISGINSDNGYTNKNAHYENKHKNIPNSEKSEVYVNQSFSFGSNNLDARTPIKKNDSSHPFLSPVAKDHKRKSSLNYTPVKNYIQPPPVSSASNNIGLTPPNQTFRKSHRYKHSSVSINYNELLNITNKIDSSDPSSGSLSAEQEDSHILINKYMEFPTVIGLSKRLSFATYMKCLLSLSLIVLISLTHPENIAFITIITLLQSHMILFLIKELTSCIKSDNFYSVYNFDNPFGFQRLPVILEYAGLLHICYKVLNLFFEFVEMVLIGHGDGLHGSHSHSGHQHNNSDEDSHFNHIKYNIGLGTLILSGLLSGYLKDWYTLTTVFLGILFSSDSLFLKLALIILLCKFLINKLLLIVNQLLVYLNMSSSCTTTEISNIKKKINQILMTEKYELNIGSIDSNCCIVLLKVDSQVNIIDIDLKQRIYSLLKAEIKVDTIMLTVQY